MKQTQSSNNASYILGLLTPTAKRPTERKVWAMGLESVLVPFFKASNVVGKTEISPEALGAPLQVAYDKTGSVRITSRGTPVIVVAKEIRDNVRYLQDNFVANLVNFTSDTQREHPAEYQAMSTQCAKAGALRISTDRKALADAYEAMAVAEAKAKIDACILAEAKARIEAENEARAEAEAQREPAGVQS